MFSIFFIVGFAVFLGMALAIFATRQKLPGNQPLVPPEDDAREEKPGAPSVGMEDLQKLGARMCEKNKLTVKERITNSEREVFWITESDNEFFFGSYVLAFCTVDENTPYIPLAELLEFKDFVKSVGSTKGLFFTNGYFTRDVHQMLEGPKVALYNKRKVLEELGLPK